MNTRTQGCQSKSCTEHHTDFTCLSSLIETFYNTLGYIYFGRSTSRLFLRWADIKYKNLLSLLKKISFYMQVPQDVHLGFKTKILDDFKAIEVHDMATDLADTTDAHVQRLCVTACPIQHLGRQLHHKAWALGFTFESARVVWVVVYRQPLMVLVLVLLICVSWTLLGTEITGIWRAILRDIKTYFKIFYILEKGRANEVFHL